jgi:hypothetical protein
MTHAVSMHGGIIRFTHSLGAGEAEDCRPPLRATQL